MHYPDICFGSTRSTMKELSRWSLSQPGFKQDAFDYRYEALPQRMFGTLTLFPPLHELVGVYVKKNMKSFVFESILITFFNIKIKYIYVHKIICLHPHFLGSLTLKIKVTYKEVPYKSLTHWKLSFVTCVTIPIILSSTSVITNYIILNAQIIILTLGYLYTVRANKPNVYSCFTLKFISWLAQRTISLLRVL